MQDDVGIALGYESLCLLFRDDIHVLMSWSEILWLSFNASAMRPPTNPLAPVISIFFIVCLLSGKDTDFCDCQQGCFVAGWFYCWLVFGCLLVSFAVGVFCCWGVLLLVRIGVSVY